MRPHHAEARIQTAAATTLDCTPGIQAALLPPIATAPETALLPILTDLGEAPAAGGGAFADRNGGGFGGGGGFVGSHAAPASSGGLGGGAGGGGGGGNGIGGGGGSGGGGAGGGTPGSPPVDVPVPVSSNAPEPGTWVMMISGIGAVGGALRWSRRPIAG